MNKIQTRIRDKPVNTCRKRCKEKIAWISRLHKSATQNMMKNIPLDMILDSCLAPYVSLCDILKTKQSKIIGRNMARNCFGMDVIIITVYL